MPQANSIEAAIRKYTKGQRVVGPTKCWRKSPRGYLAAVRYLDEAFGEQWLKSARLSEINEAESRTGLIAGVTGVMVGSLDYATICDRFSQLSNRNPFPSGTCEGFESVKATWNMIVKELRAERKKKRVGYSAAKLRRATS